MQSQNWVAVLLGAFLCGACPATFKVLALTGITIVLATMMWARARADRVPARKIAWLLVRTLVGVLPVVVFVWMIDWRDGVDEIMPAFFAVLAAHEFTDSTLRSVFGRSWLRLEAARGPSGGALEDGKHGMVRTPWLMLLAMGLFGLCWIRVGAPCARHSAIALSVAVTGTGLLKLWVVRRTHSLLPRGTRGRNLTAPLRKCTGAGRALGRFFPHAFRWAVFLAGTVLLWVFGERPPIVSDPWPSTCALYVVVLGLVSSGRMAKTELDRLGKAVARFRAGENADAVEAR